MDFDRPKLLIRNHEINLADTLIGLTKPRKPPIGPCTAWDSGEGKHFWKKEPGEHARETDRCWYCLQTRHACRAWPLTLEKALEGN